MAFLDELRSYLEHVRAHPGEAAQPAASPISKEQYMVWVMEALDALEEQGVGAEELGRKYGELSSDYSFYKLIHLEALLPQWLGLILSADEKHQCLKGAIWMQAGLEPSMYKRSRRIAIEHALQQIESVPVPVQMNSWYNPLRYSREVLLVQNDSLTPAGHAFLLLVGLDSVAWLLALECELSIGWTDHFRITKDQCTQIGEGEVHQSFTSHPNVFIGLAHLEHLCTMGIAAQWTFEHYNTGTHDHSFTFTPESIELFKQLGAGTHPFQPLVQSILQDIRDQTFESTLGVAPPHERAAESTMRLARDMAHEVRNKLTPIQSQLQRLYRAAEARGVPVAAHQAVIDVGIHQLHQYLKALLNVSTLLPKQSSKFDPSAALREVVLDILSEYPIHIEAAIPDPLPLLLGQRDRFVLAFRNLVRNAAQAVKKENGTHGEGTDKKVRVTVRHVEDLGELEITVEDSGPGIPSAYREQIFDAGFSMRDGGSGHGLAIVHQVVKGEFRGSIICDESPGLKGARFMAVLPLPERKTL